MLKQSSAVARPIGQIFLGFGSLKLHVNPAKGALASKDLLVVGVVAAMGSCAASSADSAALPKL